MTEYSIRTTFIGILITINLIGIPVISAEPEVEQGEQERQTGLEIRIAGVFVDNQEKAEKFYTEKLGFVVKSNVPVGKFRWLTVVSKDNPDGTELLLEPNENDAAEAYQKSIYEQGIPATTFFVVDLDAEYERLHQKGVKFVLAPTETGEIKIAIFDDTCGNLIQIVQESL